MKALAGSHFKNLRKLSIGMNGIKDEGMIIFLVADYLKNLQQLDLTQSDFGIKGIKAIVENSANLSNLRELTLCCNKIGD